MKKFATIALSAVLLLTLFAGCGAKETAPETAAPETTLAPETTVAPETEGTEVLEEEAPAANAADEVMTDPSMPEPNEAGQLILEIYKNHKPTDMPLVINNLDTADADVMASGTGLANGDKVASGAISEIMMGQPYSLVVLKAKDAADAAALAQEMYDGIDMRKWICMEADTKVAGSYDDVAFLFMVNSEFADSVSTDSMLEAVKAAAGKDVAVIG